MPPPRNDARNDPPRRACPGCGTAFPPAGRRRTATPQTAPVTPPQLPRRQGTIYQCADCDTRYHASQWCPDCNRPCRRLGPGGACPCGELLTIDELLNSS